MARLSRTESRQQNRELLVASARRLFLRDGFQAASLAAVADEAGFSTGVVYSNFSGKAELGLIVLRQIQAERMEALRAVLTAPGSFSRKLTGFEEWAEDSLDSGWPRLELEFALEARSDPVLIEEEAQRHDTAISIAAASLEGLVPKEYRGVVPLEAIAQALIDLSIGLGMRRLIDPTVRVDALTAPLRQALKAWIPAS